MIYFNANRFFLITCIKQDFNLLDDTLKEAVTYLEQLKQDSIPISFKKKIKNHLQLIRSTYIFDNDLYCIHDYIYVLVDNYRNCIIDRIDYVLNYSNELKKKYSNFITDILQFKDCKIAKVDRKIKAMAEEIWIKQDWISLSILADLYEENNCNDVDVLLYLRNLELHKHLTNYCSALEAIIKS